MSTWEKGTKYKTARDKKEISYDSSVWEKQRTYKHEKYVRLDEQLKNKSPEEQKELKSRYETRLNHFRKRIDFTFDDWSKEDWDKIRTLPQMRDAIDLRTDRYNKPTLSNACTIDQARLTWEHTKGFSHPKDRSGGYIFETHEYGTRAKGEILFNGKIYRKGQFIPRAYIDMISYLLR